MVVVGEWGMGSGTKWEGEGEGEEVGIWLGMELGMELGMGLRMELGLEEVEDRKLGVMRMATLGEDGTVR